jgi:YggT family protein
MTTGEVKPGLALLLAKVAVTPAARLASAASTGETRVITILFEIAQQVLHIYLWAVILAAVFSTLASFGVLDTRNRLVWAIGDFLFRITEPALKPIRRFMPNFGSLDLSPLVLVLLVSAAEVLLGRIYAAIVYGNIQGLFL